MFELLIALSATVFSFVCLGLFVNLIVFIVKKATSWYYSIMVHQHAEDIARRVSKKLNVYSENFVNLVVCDSLTYVEKVPAAERIPPNEFPDHYYTTTDDEFRNAIIALVLFRKYNFEAIMHELWDTCDVGRHPCWQNAKVAVLAYICDCIKKSATDRDFVSEKSFEEILQIMLVCADHHERKKNPLPNPKEAIEDQELEELEDSEEFDRVKTCINNISEIIQCTDIACKSAYILQSPEAKLDVVIYILHSWYRTLCTQSTPANAEKFSAWIVFKLHDYAEFQLHLDSEFAHDLITHRLDIYDSIMTLKLADKSAALSERLRQFVINDSEKEYFNEAPLLIPANTELRIENALTTLYLQVMRDTDPMFQQILDALTED